MLFTAGAVSQGLLGAFGTGLQSPGERETYAVGRRLAYALMVTFGTRMAAVFMFATSTIRLRTAVLPRWVSFVGFASGLVLLLIIDELAWVMLLFPCWASGEHLDPDRRPSHGTPTLQTRGWSRTWLQRYRVRHYVRNSIWLLPAVLGEWTLGGKQGGKHA